LSKHTSKQQIGKTKQQGTRMTGSNRDLSMLTLNVNDLKAPIIRLRMANWVKNQHLTMCYLQETKLTKKTCLTAKGGKKVFQQMKP
jgi:hypothetical protein